MSIPTLRQALIDFRQALEETSMTSVAPKILKKLKAQRREYLFSEVHPKPEPYVNRTYAAAIATRLEELWHVHLIAGWVYADGLPILTAEELQEHMWTWFHHKFNRDLCNVVLQILSEKTRGDP